MGWMSRIDDRLGLDRQPSDWPGVTKVAVGVAALAALGVVIAAILNGAWTSAVIFVLVAGFVVWGLRRQDRQA